MGKMGADFIITYHGVDGACAAAAALVARPDARIVVTSARRVAETLDELADLPEKLGQVHVCGLGVYCPWEHLEHAAARARKRGGRLYWHCGRGYLDDRREDFEQFCRTAFSESGTNTAAVASYFKLENDISTQLLLRLAPHDHNLPTAPKAKPLPEEENYWRELIQAGIAQYIKFQDQSAYLGIIQNLAVQRRDAHDELLVASWRRAGYKYLLHGNTKQIRTLKGRIQRCAKANRPIIITGESGVGKEHVAKLIMEASPRAAQPLIAVNCALYAGNASLANSDLFGHKKGAFTGATHDRKGKFLAADGGVLFLDELGDLPLEVQAKLLRVLEDGRIMPEGSDEFEHVVDVLIIAATNRDLPGMMRDNTFRTDLYHRLATLRIEVPPLRDRLADIPPIVQHRLEILEEEGHRRKLSAAEWRALEGYSWPGNVRQLIKVIERAVLLDISVQEALHEEQTMGVHEERDAAMQPRTTGHGSLLPSRPEEILPMKEVQREYAAHAWELCGRNYSTAANALKIAPNTLRYRWLEKS